MFQGAMSTNSSTLSEESGLANFNPLLLQNTSIIPTTSSSQLHQTLPKKAKKKRNLPGNPDPEAEVIALSPKSLLATNRFICEVCNKGFQRDQNLQLHRRGHNLPWKLKQRNKEDVIRKKVYVCPEIGCVHHHPSRALGDLTGIKKHFCRKHGEKKFKCDKCSKIYAVRSDWKAHSKTCGTREYRCDCGTLFSRRDSFITHRAFCDALADESTRLSTNPFSIPNGLTPPPPPPPPPPSLAAPPLNHPFSNLLTTSQNPNHPNIFPFSSPLAWEDHQNPQNPNPNNPLFMQHIKSETHHFSPPPFFQPPPSHFLSATALLQKAVSVGAVAGGAQLLTSPHYQQQENQPTHDHGDHFNTMLGLASLATWGKNNEGFTRDFLGLTAGDHYGSNGANDATSTANGCGGGEGGDEIGDMLKFTSGLHYDVTTGYKYNDVDTSSSLLLKSLHYNHIDQQQQQQQQQQQHMHDHDHGEDEHVQQVEGFGNFVGGDHQCEPPRLGGSDSFVFLMKP